MSEEILYPRKQAGTEPPGFSSGPALVQAHLLNTQPSSSYEESSSHHLDTAQQAAQPGSRGLVSPPGSVAGLSLTPRIDLTL